MKELTNINLIKYRLPIYLMGLLPLSLLFGTLIAEVLVFFIIVLFFYELILKKNFLFFNNKLFIITSIIYIYLLINLFNSSNFELSFNRSVFFLRFPIFALAVGYFIKKFDFDLNHIFKLWMITICIVIFDLYFQFIFDFNLLGFKTPGSVVDPVTGEVTRSLRLSGFLKDELKIAHLLIGFTMHVIIFYFVKNKNLKLFYLSIVIYLIILFLINERANVIKGIFIIFFSYLFLNGLEIKKKIFFFSVIISIIFSILIFNKNVNQRFVQEVNLNSLKKDNIIEFFKNRIHGSHYLSGIEIYKKNPFLGSGIKTFRDACNDVDLKKYYKNSDFYLFKCSTHPHQVHIELLSELGMLGYLLFIILFLYLLTKSIKIYLINKNSNILCPILFIITQYLPFIPSGSFFTNFTAIIFWMNVGLIYSEILKYE